MHTKTIVMICMIADEIYNEELKGMDANEFFEKYDSGELDELILPHLNYVELIDNVRAELVTYFEV